MPWHSIVPLETAPFLTFPRKRGEGLARAKYEVGE